MGKTDTKIKMESSKLKQEKIIVGEIPYLNTLPIFESLRNHFPLEYVIFKSGHPSELNHMLRAGTIDVSPSSSIEYGNNHDLYYIIPDISISSRIKVKSVTLFSPFPIEQENSFRVFVTRNSATSVSLLKIILCSFMGKKVEVAFSKNPEDDAAREKTPFLLIGDEAIKLTLENAENTKYLEYDLGEMWHSHTGHPFVFALWIVSKTSWHSKSTYLKKFARALLDAKKISLHSIRFRDSRMPSPSWIPLTFLHEYWLNLSYDLDRELEGLTLFFRLAREMGELKDVPPISFLPLP